MAKILWWACSHFELTDTERPLECSFLEVLCFWPSWFSSLRKHQSSTLTDFTYKGRNKVFFWTQICSSCSHWFFVARRLVRFRCQIWTVQWNSTVKVTCRRGETLPWHIAKLHIAKSNVLVQKGGRKIVFLTRNFQMIRTWLLYSRP